MTIFESSKILGNKAVNILSAKNYFRRNISTLEKTPSTPSAQVLTSEKNNQPGNRKSSWPTAVTHFDGDDDLLFDKQNFDKPDLGIISTFQIRTHIKYMPNQRSPDTAMSFPWCLLTNSKG